ncbi:flagellar hook assembly protein FlgD [Pseudomonas viridiflava]|uniref:Basal-body rod modification protein FlgD n=1 Tax=Pseudomonas viridiflava TaxID=33069 RepID=A0A3M5P7N7_PSEVI|nr:MULTISPECIES: flagellar hook assembly protein FlgD [Pseudomonas syringae group]MBA1230765.1 flagellar hook assembly protein FlgD [Pseudomonas viridiflava]MCF5708244.1 flagellar hook assembly protein FlgD [Pseudomonas syringae]RMT80033.1 Flagellar basal body rod modification protein [Pseudomonas viridiflava]
MAVENNVSTSFVNSLQNPTPTKTDSTSTLGKDSFLQLLVTQMKNQNPLDPQDNTEFVAQLAQFSSVESLQNLTKTVDSIAGSNQSTQALQASSLVGRSVIIDAGSTSVDTAKGMIGTVAVPATSAATSVKIYDAQSNLVNTVDLGTLPAGSASFAWDGTASDGTVAPAGTYSFTAAGSVEGKNTQFTTYLPATVNSVTLGINGAETKLNLASGSVALSKVQTIGL